MNERLDDAVRGIRSRFASEELLENRDTKLVDEMLDEHAKKRDTAENVEPFETFSRAYGAGPYVRIHVQSVYEFDGAAGMSSVCT